MTKPQQPELRRSGLGSTDQDSAKINADETVSGRSAGAGPVPEDNQPGHHPPKEQDQPEPPA